MSFSGANGLMVTGAPIEIDDNLDFREIINTLKKILLKECVTATA